MVMVMMVVMVVALRKSRCAKEQNDGEEQCLFHSPIISPNERTAIPRELLFWVRSGSRLELGGHEKSSIAFTAVLRL